MLGEQGRQEKQRGNLGMFAVSFKRGEFKTKYLLLLLLSEEPVLYRRRSEEPA